jgi:hypothetical protein
MPVKWVDASAENLRADLQEDYLRMAISSYSREGDALAAKKAWDELGAKAPEVLAKVQQVPGKLSAEDFQRFSAVIQVGAIQPGEPTQATAAGEPEKGKGTNLTWLLVIMCLVLLALAGGLFYYFFLRGKGGLPLIKTPAQQAAEAAKQAEYTDFASQGKEPPISQFMASYKLGDDLFDDSFSIDSPTGEFLGECGVGIAETIGVGEPKKVTGFEVWLFDKNDIQTVTKVLLSEHAFTDDTIRQRLAAKGEPVCAEQGSTAALETATLRLEARIVEMKYGEGALPDQSFFDGMILELSLWQI